LFQSSGAAGEVRPRCSDHGGPLRLIFKSAFRIPQILWIRKWTPNVEVINPPELRETFRQHAVKDYARYH